MSCLQKANFLLHLAHVDLATQQRSLAALSQSLGTSQSRGTPPRVCLQAPTGLVRTSCFLVKIVHIFVVFPQEPQCHQKFLRWWPTFKNMSHTCFPRIGLASGNTTHTHVETAAKPKSSNDCHCRMVSHRMAVWSSVGRSTGCACTLKPYASTYQVSQREVVWRQCWSIACTAA